MKLKPRAVVIGAALLAVTLVGTGCQTKKPSATGTASDDVTIMVGGAAKVIYLPAKLAERLGYFTDQGLNVKLSTHQPG